MGIYTTYIFTLNSLSQKNRTSEPLKAGKKLREPVGPAATSSEAAWSSASIRAGEEDGAREEARALKVVCAVITSKMNTCRNEETNDTTKWSQQTT